ncbi:MAG: metallophosphoesterase [Magnetococcales bacterium]|uniref:Metallophosphoesterase n=1 Tax=Candidatus Magnetobacterium casense TaxID=1455061 RepID=A0ABS6S2A0_9BACT|nr:metallophosphoesterase [Candidatus Magnetobacterium casensis]MBF0607528.1 metallophosphoesterase [Nitrospirota bacterium]MBV6342975.1 metallophosphoesterase [Candidatus Magnetobacterium casensis]
MKSFLFIYFSVYGLMHYYLLRGIITLSAHPGPVVRVAIVLLALLMINAPMLVRYTERHGYEQTAIVISHVGYLWMGFVLIAVSALLVSDLCRFGINLFMSDGGKLGRVVVLPLVISLLLSAYAYFEALHVTTERLTISHPKIPAGVSIKVVQVSDVHIGLIVRHDRLKRIFDVVSKEQPDVLVSTGDFVDSQLDNLDVIAANINSIPATYGKFACLGNHEFYAGTERSVRITQEAGFTVLRGQGVTVGGVLNIAGVSDYTVGDEFSEREVLSRLPRQNFTILLKHRPTVDTDSTGDFDLQLSGHTHKGQIFPFNILTYFHYPIHAGLLRLRDDAYLYVSRGSGTWGPPMRLFSPPEVTVVTLKNK